MNEIEEKLVMQLIRLAKGMLSAFDEYIKEGKITISKTTTETDIKRYST